jgi:hypothetical protein
MDEKTLTKYIVAFTYGDGCLIKHGKYSRFEANNLAKNRDYNEWRANILGSVTKVTMKDVDPQRGNRQLMINTRTNTHPKFDKIRSRMYLNGVKVIDPHYLKLFDWETLAILYMDDGSLRDVTEEYKGKVYHNFYPNIATNSFSYGDNLLLKKAIKENLDIEFNINNHSKNKHGEMTYILVLTANSRDKFFDGIRKYIKHSFEYKINPNAEPVIDGGDMIRTVEKSTEIIRNDNPLVTQLS